MNKLALLILAAVILYYQSFMDVGTPNMCIWWHRPILDNVFLFIVFKRFRCHVFYVLTVF